ncbi:MAG TPA: hypothetical protein VGL25_10140 [Casimicrobiaceae bacterium]|jgi:hypothetical protein
MQRPPKHVANDAAGFVQHVAVDAVLESVEPVEPIVVFHGVIGSIVSVIPVVGRTVESIQLRPIVAKQG